MPFLFLFAIYSLCKFISALKKKQKKNNKEGIDVTKAIENPNLLQAIKEHKENPDEEGNSKLTYALTSATFLALSYTDNLNMEHKNQNEYIVKEGSSFNLHFISDDQGNSYLPIFTDWKHVKDFTADDVSGLIFPAKDIFNFFDLNEDNLKGIIINPGEEDCLLEKEHINMLITIIKSDECLNEILNLVEKNFRGNDGSLNIEDFVLAMGNLTGYFIYKVIEEKNIEKISTMNLEPGTVFLTEDANKLSEQAFARIRSLLELYGFDLNNIIFEENIYKSNLTYLDIIEDIISPVTEILKKYEFANLKAVDICAVGISVVVNHFYKTISIGKSLSIAFYGIIEGSKTVPISI